MAYVIVHYLPFLATAAAFGLVVGWWATGSRRGKAAESVVTSATDEGDTP